MKAAIFGKRRQAADDLPRIVSLVDALSSRGFMVAIERRFYEAMSRERGLQLEADDIFDAEEYPGADIAVSIGGDGTFLRTARWIGAKETPIIGFNTGHLGFLDEENLADADARVEGLIEGRFFIEPR